MKKVWLIAICQLLFAAAAAAQTITSVSGTVLDKSGIPYAGGTVQTQLSVPSGNASPTITATAAPLVLPPPTTISNTGTFSLGLVASGSITPAATQYIFIICAQGTPTTLPDPMLSGAQCFTTSPITISGSSQSITSNINSVPPPPLTSATIVFPPSLGGTGVNQPSTQSVLTNGTGIAPGTSQAQPSITISGVTTSSVCYASPAGPVPASWLTGVQIGFVAVSTNTATPYLTNSTTGLVSPAGIQLNVRCIL